MKTSVSEESNREPAIPVPVELELNEAATLRAEESRARYDARMEELDRRDRAGSHDLWRS